MRLKFPILDLFGNVAEAPAAERPTLEQALDRAILELNRAELHRGSTVLLNIEDVRELCRAAHRQHTTPDTKA